MHFSFPVPTNQTSVSSPSLALDPTHPIITSLQETLNYKLNYPIARIRESKSTKSTSSWVDLWFFARTHNAEVRFEYPRWFMYDPLDWGWSKFSMLFSKNRNLSSPSPPRILGHFFSSLDSQGNLRYGFGSNENLPRLTQTVRNPSSSSTSTIPVVNNSSFQFRFNRRQQPYLDSIEYRRNANSGLLLNVSCKIDPHSHQRNSSSSAGRQRQSPAFLSRFGIGYALTPTSGSMLSTKMKNLTSVRASIEYYSQFPQNFIEGEQGIHHHHHHGRFSSTSSSATAFTIPERRKGYSYVLASSSITWEKNMMIGINQKKCINFFLDGGAWLNTHGPAGSLFFSSLTVVLDKNQPLLSIHQSHLYDRYRNSSTVLNLQHNSDSGMTMSAVVPFSFNNNENDESGNKKIGNNQKQNKMIRLGSFWTIPITENQKERNKRGVKVVVELESPLELMRHFWRKLQFVISENNSTSTNFKSGSDFDNTSIDGEEGKVAGELRRGTCLTFAAEVSPLNSRPRYGMHLRG